MVTVSPQNHGPGSIDAKRKKTVDEAVITDLNHKNRIKLIYSNLDKP